jgi:putative flippase GtrA
VLTQQFLRFAVVGVLGFIIDAGVLAVAVHWLHWGLYAGRAVSFLLAVTATWVLNRNYAFHATASQSRLAEWLRYLLSNAVGGSVNLGSYALLIHQSATLRETPTLAVALGSIAGMLVNFTLMKVFVFRSRRHLLRETG